VGAGPSGLILALSLVRNGVPVRVIEKSTTNRLGQRGAGLSPRSLEIFESLGVVEEIIARAIDVPLFRAYKMPEGVEILREFATAPRLDPTPDRPYINFVLFGQDGLDQVLRAELAKHGCSVEMGAELHSLNQDNDNVRVKILHHDLDQSSQLGHSVEDASYEWVIGADGARGVVRKQVGMTFIGETTELAFVIGDITTKDPLPDRWHLWGDITDVFMGERTVIRPTDVPGVWSFILGGRKLASAAEICANENSLKAYIKANTGNRGDIQITNFLWTSPYRISVRMVDTFKKGRVFVTGDAGHVHSPTGGQGLNTGIQDSYNLGWKLALVAKGLAIPSLLETFNEERYPVVSEMLNMTTDLMKKTLEHSNNEKGWNRTGDVNQLGVNYRGSTIVVNEAEYTGQESVHKGSSYNIEAGGYVQPGDRAPDAPGLIKYTKGSGQDAGRRLFKLLDSTRHTVLIFSDKIDYRLVLASLQRYDRELVRPMIITRPGEGADITAYDVFEDGDGHASSAYKGPEGVSGVFVIRPDGVVGARVGSTEALGRYFQGVFGQSP
ncbi:hypothetical protein CVT25_015680, partial [Psilocybe cyanescens]